MDEQLTFLHPEPLETQWILYIDGAARNNPGPSGVGIIIKHNDETLLEAGYFLGTKTNNQAEYLALIIGLMHLYELAESKSLVNIITDSQLLARQITGHYRVKEPALQKLHAQALKLLRTYNYTMQHVLRAHNREADKMANHGIDKKIILPTHLAQTLHDIL